MNYSGADEQVLSSRGRLLRDLADLAVSLGSTLWILDESGEELRYASPGFADLWGLTISELSDAPRAWQHVIHDDDRASALHGLEEATHGRPSTREFRIRRTDGAIRWMCNRAFILRAEDETVEGLACVLTDVTAQRALQRRAALLEQGVLVARLSVWEYELRGPRAEDAVPSEGTQAAPGFPQGKFIKLGQVLGLMGMSEPDLARGLGEVQRCVDGETQEWTFEYQNQTPGMDAPWRLARGFVRRNDDLTPKSIIGVGFDITAQRQLQENFRRAKEQQELAAQIARLSHWTCHLVDGLAGSAIVDPEVSTTAPGYQEAPSPADFTTTVTALGMHADDLPAVLDAIQACIDGRTTEFHTEYRSSDKAGSLMWRYARGTVERASDGTPLSFTGSAIDITERRLAEEESRRIKQRQELALRGSGVDLWELELSAGHIDPNQLSFIHIYERAAIGTGALPRRAHAIEVAPTDRERVRIAVQALLDGHTRDFQVEHRVQQEDGNTRWKLSRGVLQYTAPEERPSLIGASVDITDLRRVQDELREAKKLAETANRAKDDFLANVSHEIRTPMNAILGMTELVMDQPMTRYQRQLLETSKSATKSLLGIINDLLDFAKIEAGKLELERAELSLRATVWDTLRALAVRAHRKGLDLVCQFSPDVPDALVGDAGRLRQIILNIVGNAIKFTERGEVDVRISSLDEGSQANTVTLRVSVRDTGIGIPPDKTERIFRAFEQEDASTTRRYGGTGLGLSIAADLVALMHGTIHVESELGRGSTFVFTASLERQTHSAEARSPSPPSYLSGLPVLVVDESPASRHVLGDYLRGWQMIPTTVSDARAAMAAIADAAAADRPYALMLLDSRMPDTDGLSLAMRIRERPELSAMRIILLTSGDSPRDPRHSMDLTLTDAEWLKPIRPEDMLEGICHVLSQSNWAQRLAPDAATEARSDAGRLLLDAQSRSQPSAALRILMVDDDEFSAMFTRELLRKRNHDVTVVANGRDALALLKQTRIDLMLLDVHVANAEGFDVVRNIRDREHASNEHLPVIALAARSRPRDRDRCIAVGMDEFLSKPVRPANLLAAIDRFAYGGGSAVGTAR